MKVLLLSLIFTPLVIAGLLWLIKRSKPLLLDGIAILTAVFLTGALLLLRPTQNVLVIRNYFPLVLDGLSFLLLLAANSVALFILIYSIQYFKDADVRHKFYSWFFLMLAGVNGVVLAGDLVFLFLFLELAALSAYFLVAFNGGAKELEAALKYFVLGEIASLFILIGLGLIFHLTGTLNLANIAKIFPQNAYLAKSVITVLFLAGFGMKAALVPFHFWLPDAHTSAPSPVSAILSGVIIKALGVYALLRIIYNILGINPQLVSILTALGAIALLVGGLLSLTQWDIKRLMAYSSISQIGYIVLGIGLATPLGVMGGLFHLFNHAFMKALLFLNAGAIEKATGTRDLRKLGGLAKTLPVVYSTTLVGTLAISGIPPFNGFWSKFYIILGCLQAGQIWLALIAVVGSILTLAAYLKIQKYAFWGPDPGITVKPVPLSMDFSLIALSFLCLLIGLGSALVIGWFINPALMTLAQGTNYGQIVFGGK